jgi:hypothetical protein
MMQLRERASKETSRKSFPRHLYIFGYCAGGRGSLIDDF